MAYLTFHAVINTLEGKCMEIPPHDAFVRLAKWDGGCWGGTTAD